MFALAACVLQRSGAYSQVVRSWPPGGDKATLTKWTKKIQEIGLHWRANFSREAPPAVRSWWATVWNYVDLPLAKVQDFRDLCEALLQLSAAADEAAAGAGIPSRDRVDSFERQAGILLLGERKGQIGASLCRNVHCSKLRVLPKQHSPRSGMTVRSLTHHLALCTAPDIVPHWITADTDIDTPCLNVLLIPWPLKVVPIQFSGVAPTSAQLVDGYGFFTYSPPQTNRNAVVARIKAIVKKAELAVGHIDGIVLPELALTTAEHLALKRQLVRDNRFLIAGVCEPSLQEGHPGRNYLVFDIQVRDRTSNTPTYLEVKQDKHHRWRLDRSQIVQYGLGRQLEPAREWWEHIEVGRRELNFVTVKDWLTVCVLVCEDLARPDPVGDIVRAVGPNLVLALLMDGPQLAQRWPGRYATVLADDPGCSVLTLSSIGMVDLCRPPPNATPSRTVALWKDAKNRDPLHINLPPGTDGIVLALTRDMVEEHTPDGRTDDGNTAYPALSGVYPVRSN
jgi:hypothetical protein